MPRSAAAPASRPRVGRPRADRRRRARPPEEEILFAAARLFARRGFAGTSTRAIAGAAGLRQPSLFHWFPSKEAILGRLLERTLAPSLAFAEGLAAQPGSPAARLYRLLRFDVRHLCAYPFDPAFVLSPEARQPRFARFWADRDRLIAHVAALIEEGVRAGELVAPDPRVAALSVVGMGEAALLWSRHGGPRRSPEAASREVAALALRALLRDPARLALLEREAAPT
jgi:AcrR family transcriptional regulator